MCMKDSWPPTHVHTHTQEIMRLKFKAQALHDRLEVINLIPKRENDYNNEELLVYCCANC